MAEKGNELQLKEDRRVRRTKRLLKQGLAEMMNEKPFKDITVKNITDKVDLNRGTFYLHYTDTYDLLRKVEDEILQDFQDMIDKFVSNIDSENPTLFPIFSPIVDYIIENTELCRNIFTNEATVSFLEKFQLMITKNGSELLSRQYPNATVENYEYFIHFVTGGIVNLLKKWFATGTAMKKEELIDLADKMMRGAANSILN